MSLLVGVLIAVGFVTFVGFAWLFSGLAIKSALLLGPPLGVTVVGGAIAYIASGITGGIVIVVTLVVAWVVYEKWEYSNTYDRLIKKIDKQFMSE